MKNGNLNVIFLISLVLISVFGMAGCAGQPTKSTDSLEFQLYPAEVKAGREAKTTITCSGLPQGEEVKIMVTTKQSLSIDETLSCEPVPEVNSRGEFSTSLTLSKFSPGEYTVSVTDKDYDILSSAILRVR